MFSGWTPRYGASSGYSAPPSADPGLQSFRDQHLAQLEQLQRMHQRQMESVLPVGSPLPPRPYFPPRQSYPYPPPYSHNVPPPGYQSPALPPDTDKPPPPPPTTEQQPPPPPPPDGGPPNTTTATSSSLEEQQQYWYNQHLQNLQQKAKSQGREAPPPALETALPPSSAYSAPPPSQQPPPPPVEDSRPPLPAENVSSGINLSEDPEQAQRLKTLQEAAAHWQQHEQHRLGFQYQGIMQKHSAMQQLLQRYQQIVQDPPHLAAMTVDVQLQHYEMQQKQFLPLHQEWENQFKKWQELLQTYPHKDQLQEYQVQWASWQNHIKATKTHLKDKVASLKSLKQQYGGSHYIGGIAMVPPYPAYSPVIPPAVPAALPTGLTMPPPFTAPVPPVYGAGPPPSLPPAYPEATPPLPPVTAPPPPPPASSAPPPPPPVSSPPKDDVQPPLPPSTETQPPPPAASSEPPTMPSVPKSAPSTSASPPVTTTGSSAVSSAHSTIPTAGKDPPPTAAPFLPGNQAPPTGMSYQAQQALKNTAPPQGQGAPPLPSNLPPLSQSAPPVPSHNPALSQTAPPVPSYNSSLGPSAPPLPFHNPPLGQSAPPLPFHNAPLGQVPPPVPPYKPPPLGYSVPPVPSHQPPLGQSAPPVPSMNPPLSLGPNAPPLPSHNVSQGQTAPPVPYHNPPLDVPSSGMEKQSEDTKPSNPPGPPPVPDQEPMSTAPPPPAGMKIGGQLEGPRESRFTAQGPGFAPPRFPPPGTLGFHSSRPLHDRENQQWTNEQKDQSTPADTSKQYGESSNYTAPASRWDRPKEHSDQSWDKPKPPHVSQSTAKDVSEYPTGPMSDRESNHPAEMWNRSDGPPFNRRAGQSDDMGNKWDQPPESRWSASKEPSSDRWSSSQDRWGAENASSSVDRFDDPQNSGMKRFGGPEAAPYDRYGDGTGPPYDRHAPPEAPFRERFGPPDGSQRFRFNAPEMQPRGRARFPGIPPRGRFPFPESHPRHRFSGVEGRTPSFGYPEAFPRDRFGGPEQPSARDHFEGSEQPLPQERFGGFEQSSSQERFGGPDMRETSYQEGPRDPKMPPSHNRFGGINDKFGGPDAPDRPKGQEFPSSHREYFRGPDMPPTPGDKFKAHEMPPTTGDRFKGTDMPSAAEDRFKNPEMLPSGDRFKGPEMPLPAEDRFRNPEMPSPGNRFKGPEIPPPVADRFGGHKMPPPPGDRFGSTEKQPSHQQNRFGDFDGPPRDNWSHADKKEDLLHESRENRVPFSDRWGAGDRRGGRPEWPRGRGDGASRPPLLGDSPLEKPKILSNTENAPKESYQSQFNKKQVPKATDAHLGPQSLSAKQEQQDEMKQEEPSKESALKKAESSTVGGSAASEKETSASSELQKPNEASESGKGETKASDISKTDPEGGQTLPVPNEAKKPVLATLLPSDATKGPGPAGDTAASDKNNMDLSDLTKPSESEISVPEAAKPDAPVTTSSTLSKMEEVTDSSNSLRKQDPFQLPLINKTGGLLPTPTTGIGAHFAPHTNQVFRPQAPHLLPPVRPGDPWAPPVRPGGPRAAPPIRPGGPRAPPPFRPGGPGVAPPFRQGGPGVAPPVRPGGPRAAPPVRPGGPRAAPPVRPGGPRAPPPGGPRAGYPVRPGAPGAPFSSWEEPLERAGQGEDRNLYAAPMGSDPMGEDTYDEADEDVMGERHGPEGRHSRPEFPDEEADEAHGYFHHEPGRPMGFRQNDGSLDPEPYEEDWPENYDMRFDHRGRGRARGFMRGRPPPRPGNREMMDVLDDRGFEPRGHLPDERPLFREGLNEPPQFGREPFLREPRLADRERFPLDPQLEMRRRDFPLEDQRLEDWERERYWRSRDPERIRDPFMDLYMRDEWLPLRPPPHDIDIRRDPWYDRYLDKDLDRVLNYNRLERPHLFDRDLDRDYPRIPEDLDLPLRDRDWLPPRRPLSPHRPFSPGRARSPLPPLPPIDRYLDDRWRLERELEDRDFRDRGELRIREYPDRPLWHEDRNPNLHPERSELEPKDGGWYPPEDRAMNKGLNPLPGQHPADPASAALPEEPAIPGGEPGAAGVLALSQRQHEIILKAAQELKMLREQKEQLDNLKNFFGDPESSDAAGKRPSDAQSSTVPLQPPSDVPVTGVDQSSSTLTASVGGRTVGAPFSGGWDGDRRGPNSGLPVGSKLSGIQQTVDYAHGRDLAIGKVEQTPYGERVMLLPEPAVDRGLPFQKDYLLDSFDRDFRDRDPYYERMKNADRRDYDRDRSDSHRDHDRDRDRHSRDERSSYRDKESSSRRSTSDRKLDRPAYEVPPPSYGGSRRGYPEDRPVMAPPLSIPPPEKKPETKNVDDLLKRPGRDSRPDRIVVIMRGLPGSGKTHVAKLIRDKEVEYGGSAPRVLSLDDYFMTEVEKVEKDPETGKKVKIKAMEYEYEPEMEETYRSGMLKTFKKTLDDGFFPFIILDSIHDRVRHFEQFWSAAKTKGFEVYLAEITADTQTCAKRNVHGRKLKDINKMADNWEPAPRHMIRLDIRSLLQDAAIEEVEMEDSEPSVEPQKDEKKAAEEEDNDRGYLPKSKWEMDTSEAKLDKLDGLKVNKRKRDFESMASRMEDYLQLPDDYDTRESEPGKKRVRWADLEEKKDADRKRAIGFVVGQTDWEKITDKSGHLAERALNRTKYI